jgi:hypothetical protein
MIVKRIIAVALAALSVPFATVHAAPTRTSTLAIDQPAPFAVDQVITFDAVLFDVG